MSAPTIKSSFGYLLPETTNGELNDLFLGRFLNTLIAGLTGIPSALVFPRWQPNPPNQPDFKTDWAAVGTINRDRDVFSAVLHTTDEAGDGTDTEYRNQILDVLCSFYGPNAESNSELFAMGLGIEQNRYAMELNGFGLVSVEATLTVPALLKEVWVMGMDTHFRMRRQQIYTYDSPNLVAAQGTIITDQNFSVPFLVKKT